MDKAGNLYVIHEGRRNLKDHPSIFVFDPNGKFIRAFGNQFQGGGHGLEVCQEGNEEFLYVCAYQNVKAFAKLTLKGYGMPANLDTWKNLLLVPELHARITLLDEKNEVVAKLGEDVENVVKKKTVNRGKTQTWKAGKFVHPHDACFGGNGDIYVAEWVQTGRVTKLKRLS